MSPEQQLDILLPGVDNVVPADELAERLGEGRTLRVKLGLDPTAPAVTLGWAVVLRKLRQFQELGHTAVLIVGDFTAQVGDPSNRDSQRTRLSAEEVRGYADSVLDGFKKILIWDDALLEVRYNSEWLGKLDMADVLELTSKVTVAQMLERGDFQKRFTSNQPISLMEFMYPLLQGMDSVAIDSDIELGGSDQLWNNMMGRILQERYGKRGQMVMTLPLLVGTDGRHKMSQSLDNYVAVDDEPAEMFGKIMSIPDHLMVQYFELATDLPVVEVQAVNAGLADGSLHPGETKRRLGREVVGLYWGIKAGLDAEAAFDQVFKRGEAPDEVMRFALPSDDIVFLPALLRDAGLAKSSSEARRLIAQGAVKMHGETITNESLPRTTLDGATVQVGKRRFVKLMADAE
ncbi:MAG: tyrosine--tRNA ligase [Acidimicrobiia bacterium]|nr:tyrosine--tRNA ligase [Acidimicrobiia bacterium]MDH3397671.1 tyrosine--tRNA ligase [Acidimicrobiia bacterium]